MEMTGDPSGDFDVDGLQLDIESNQRPPSTYARRPRGGVGRGGAEVGEQVALHAPAAQISHNLLEKLHVTSRMEAAARLGTHLSTRQRGYAAQAQVQALHRLLDKFGPTEGMFMISMAR